MVTAGKELLASQFAKLEDRAAKAGSAFMYEAAVMAGTPAISTVKSLVGDRICRLEGVLNGTCNYCLQRMEESGLTLAQAAVEARELGYAEPDPTADVEGYDAAAKLAILATIAFAQPVTYEDVTITGITGVRSSDLADAGARGQRLMLVAEARLERGGVTAQVAPARLSASHPLSHLHGHYNGLLIEADLAGEVFVRGPGAGGEATASAVISDIIRSAQLRSDTKTIS